MVRAALHLRCRQVLSVRPGSLAAVRQQSFQLAECQKERRLRSAANKIQQALRRRSFADSPLGAYKLRVGDAWQQMSRARRRDAVLAWQRCAIDMRRTKERGAEIEAAFEANWHSSEEGCYVVFLLRDRTGRGAGGAGAG